MTTTNEAQGSALGQQERDAALRRLVSFIGEQLARSQDPQDLLTAVAATMAELLGAAGCDVYVVEGDTLCCRASILRGEFDDQNTCDTLALDDFPLTRLALEERRIVAIDVDHDDGLTGPERRSILTDGHCYELCVPLVVDDSVVGLVDLFFDEPDGSEESLALVRDLCGLIAGTLANTVLVERLRGANRDLRLRSSENELLNEIARHTAASLDIEQIAHATLKQLAGILSFDCAGLVIDLVDREQAVFVWHGGGEVREVELDRDVPFADLFSTERVVTLDLDGEPVAALPIEFAGGMTSAVAIALSLNSHPMGCLALCSAERDAFRDADAGLLQRVGTQITLAINNARLYGDIQRMHVNNLKSLSSALSAKDYYTLGHAARVSAYMLLLGDELGWPLEVSEQVEEAAYLHDIGKISIADRVLLKPSGLNPHEWELMRHHPIFSAEIIKSLFSEEMMLGVRHHHERWDGRGYPDGLAGEDIPLMARAMCVVDSYDAMSFRRPYRSARTYEECLNELKRCRGAQFDPVMVDAFVRVLRRLEERRRKAIAIAEEAARLIDIDKHDLLRGPADAARPEYDEFVRLLRGVRDANPPARFLSTFARCDGKYVMIVDADEDMLTRLPIGDVIYADQELPEAFAGMRVDCTTLLVDQFGAWITGRVPVMTPEGNVAAVVAVDLPPADDVDLEGLHSDVSESFADMVRRSLAQVSRAELEAITDGMTGLYNLRYLHERLDEEVERAREEGEPISLLLCDLDGFRAFNEKRGYDEGDSAVRAAALVVEGCVRSVDLAARYGGDEFAAILIGTDGEGAAEVAERLRAAIAEARFSMDMDHLTASIGYASFPGHASTREELVDKAEWALRRAKRGGRDQVMGFGETS